MCPSYNPDEDFEELEGEEAQCPNCYHEEDFNHCTCEIRHDYIRVCGYCYHQI